MRLGIKLILYLVGAVIFAMAIFAYVSIRADSVNFLQELSQGMKGFARATGETLANTYGGERDLEATQEFLDQIGPVGSIHSLVVFDAAGRAIATSRSFDKATVARIQPDKVLETGSDEVGYTNNGGTLAYYRLEPIFDGSGDIAGAFLLIRHGAELAQDLIDRRNRIIGTTSALIVVLVVLILFLVDRNVSRPIGELIRRIGSIGRTIEATIEPRRIRENEIATLEREFNLMSERLKAMHSRLHHTEKLILVAQLAAGLAHEIATPLGVIGGRAEHLLRRERSPDEVRENLQIVQSQIDRIVRVVQRLLDFSRPKETNFRAVDILSTIDSAKALLEHRLTQKAVRTTISTVGLIPPVKGDSDQLQQVFINLFLNALDAIDSKGVLKVDVEFCLSETPGSNPGEEQVRVTFEDSGKGIEPENIESIFDPFFSTKPKGMGLGLAIVSRIVAEHRGSIRVEDNEPTGTRFVMEFPVERTAVA